MRYVVERVGTYHSVKIGIGVGNVQKRFVNLMEFRSWVITDLFARLGQHPLRRIQSDNSGITCKAAENEVPCPGSNV